MKKGTVFLILLLAIGTIVSRAESKADGKPSLTFIWHAGNHADLLLKLSEEYTKETGVEIKGLLPPLTQAYYQQIADEFARKGEAFDLCVFDSQSMSEFASAGHVVLLNESLEKSDRVKATDFDASALRRYAEYPDNSGRLYALPVNQDCMGLVYRKDLFENPAEQAAFKEKYGYHLGIPVTYDQLRDIAEFFTRPEQGLYGIAMYGSEDYDACSSAFNNLFWSFGAELWDPATGRAEGHVNSAAAKKALTFFKDLFAFAPPGFADAYVPEVNKAVVEGRVALGIQWYYYLNEYARATEGTPVKLGYATLPGQKDEHGTYHRFVMIGGQGISINAYSAKQDDAWKFLEWFMSPEQQWKWVEGGGMTGRADILDDPKFLDAAAPNRTFPTSMTMTRDYWHVPSYPQLLKVYQKYIHAAISGALSPDDALDRYAKEHDLILSGTN